MAHPSDALGKNIHVITTSATAQVGPTVGDHFYAINCTAPGTCTVEGGPYVYFASGATPGVGYIDPDTGEAFGASDTTSAAGFFAPVSTTDVALVMIAGQTVYGRFNTLKSDGTFTGFAYS